jgi:hypothetical protein
VSRADESLFDELHKLAVETLMAEIRAYKDAKEAVPPALLAQAIKLLKDNGVDSPARAKQVKDTLAAEMPDFGPEDTVPRHGAPH